MKGALLLPLVAPVVYAASCGTKIVTETYTSIVYATCAADGQDCRPLSTDLQLPDMPLTLASSVVEVTQVKPPPEQTSETQSLQPDEASPTPAESSNKPAPTYNPLPEPAIISSDTPAGFIPLKSTPGKLVIINSCTYDLSLDIVGCGSTDRALSIVAKDTYTSPNETLTCDNGGIALHVRSQGHDGPVMVEYSADAKGLLYYDLSFLDCMEKGTTNLTGCAGWKEGHQCQGGPGSPVMACQPGEYCDRQSYTVAEYGINSGITDTRKQIKAPVATSNKADGLIWEICAGNRASTGGK